VVKIELKQASEWMSATKVNTYAGAFGCPRKFFNQYIAKLKQKPSIYFPIGNIPHKTLEYCFKLKLHNKFEDYSDFRKSLLNLHDKYWKQYAFEIERFNPTPDQLTDMYKESKEMIINWLHTYLREEQYDLIPWIEQTVWARKLKLMCRIDHAGKSKTPSVFHIKDYKSGRSNKMYPDTKLQLIINWICYREETGSTIHKVGAHYLRYPESPKFWTPTKDEIDWAISQVEFVRKNTRSTDINDYPCSCGGKCQDDFILNKNDGCTTTP
jgi:ATP-dependent helicase/DNAse subunit B